MHCWSKRRTITTDFAGIMPEPDYQAIRDQFLRYASEGLEFADRATDSERRKRWLRMAAAWEKLAANVARDEEVIKSSLGLLATMEGGSSLQMPEGLGSGMLMAALNEPESSI